MAGMGDVKVAEAALDAEESYNENETSVDLNEIPFVDDPDISFAINKDVKFKEKVIPIFDPDTGIVIGYRSLGTVWNVYDLEGNFITTEELALETPWFDPIDLIGGFGGKFIFKTIARSAVKTSARVLVRGVGAAAVGLLRRALAKLVTRSALKFTATTAARMATKGRYVPVQILQLAIKYGAKSADPQKVKGVFKYVIKMSKYVGNDAGKAVYKEYTLEVVLREADNTVLHFLYK
jgi:hypothetical protein